MRRIELRPLARRALISAYCGILETAGATRADRFQARVWEPFDDLALTPKMGAPRRLGVSKPRDLRLWRVRDFEEYLIFYSVTPTVVRIERVIHAKLDYQRQFD